MVRCGSGLTIDGVGQFQSHPAGGVAFVGGDEVEPLTPRGRGFVGVDDGVVAEAERSQLAVGPAAAAEQVEEPRRADGRVDGEGETPQQRARSPLVAAVQAHGVPSS
jgi:hypothetical protein